MNCIKDLIDRCLSQNPCEADIRFNEPMKDHTTFKAGGAADCWIQPSGNNSANLCFEKFCIDLLNESKKEGIPPLLDAK